MSETQQHQQEVQQLQARLSLLSKDNALLQQAKEKLIDENQSLKTKLERILEFVKLSKQRQFGASSEANLLQQSLFDELGVLDNQSAHEESTEYTVTRKAKNHPKRRPLPSHLQRVETMIDVKAEDKQCACGCLRQRMGEKANEELMVEPAKLWVKRTIRPQYICKNKACENDSIHIATLLPRLLPKTMASPSLIADIITKKYVDHLPLYRQQAMWQRLGILLTRNTLCGWLIPVAKQCKPLIKCLNKYLLGYDILHADETVVQVMKEANRRNQQKSYIWVYRGGPPNKQVIQFEYQPTRQSQHVINFLKDYQGHVMTDGYNGYRWIDNDNTLQVIHVLCMAHARRPFAELAKLVKTPGISHHVLNYFANLYAIEKQAREQQLSPEERFYLRLTKAKPILDALFAYIQTQQNTVPPKSKLGKAIIYMLERREGLYTYLTDGRLEIDNNAIENQIRPFAIGRKNWLFLGSPKGAEAACIFYTLIQTAKANGIEPFAYLSAMLEQLPYCNTEADFEQLLPWNIVLINNNQQQSSHEVNQQAA